MAILVDGAVQISPFPPDITSWEVGDLVIFMSMMHEGFAISYSDTWLTHQAYSDAFVVDTGTGPQFHYITQEVYWGIYDGSGAPTQVGSSFGERYWAVFRCEEGETFDTDNPIAVDQSSGSFGRLDSSGWLAGAHDFYGPSDGYGDGQRVGLDGLAMLAKTGSIYGEQFMGDGLPVWGQYYWQPWNDTDDFDGSICYWDASTWDPGFESKSGYYISIGGPSVNLPVATGGVVDTVNWDVASQAPPDARCVPRDLDTTYWSTAVKVRNETSTDWDTQELLTSNPRHNVGGDAWDSWTGYHSMRFHVPIIFTPVTKDSDSYAIEPRRRRVQVRELPYTVTSAMAEGPGVKRKP